MVSLKEEKMLMEHFVGGSRQIVDQQQLLKMIKWQKIVVKDQQSKKELLKKQPDLANYDSQVWDTYKQHKINETELINQLNKHLQIQHPPSPMQQPWFNCASNQLNVVVPEQGQTTFLCSGTDIYVINPTDQWVCWLRTKGIGLNHVRGVILCGKVSGVKAVVGLVLALTAPRSVVVVCPALHEEALLQCAEKYLGVTESMVRKKLLIRNAEYNVNPIHYPLQKFKLAFVKADNNYPHLLIKFSSKSFILFPNPLTHIPSQLPSVNLSFILCYTIEKTALKQELYGLPLLHRKKIIFNRMDHKYNHKYFVTFQKQQPYCAIVDPHKYMPKVKNSEQGWRVREMKDGETMVKCKMVVKVLDGCLEVEEGKLMFKGETVINPQRVKARKRAKVALMQSHVFAFHHDCHDEEEKAKEQGHRDKFADLPHPFVRSLSPPELHILNQISTPQTLEVGQKVNIKQNNAYFIIKGAMKWQDTQLIAHTGEYIGDILSYYQKKQPKCIEVLKDTWVLQIPLHLLASELLEAYPERLYQMLSKGTIF